MKTNLSFYSRRSDSHRHPKFKMLRQLYGGVELGWAMEAKFWALNDIISEAEYCELDLSLNRNKADVCEIIGLTLSELDSFLKVLASEDVQLLEEISPSIFTTKKVKERLSTVLVEREKARKRKGSSGKDESSPELFESSPEPNKKGKERKGEESKRKESKVNTDHFFYQTAVNLFKSKTKIQNPTFDFHIKPICELLESIPENLTREDIENSINDVFEGLKEVKSIRMEYVVNNIQQKISAKREEVCGKIKAANSKADLENNGFVTQQIAESRELFTKNEEMFTSDEADEIKKYLERNDWVMASSLINAKIEVIPDL